MASFVLLLICLTLGLAVSRWAHPPPGLSNSINWWLINIALPAAVLQLVPHLHFELSLWFLFVSMWLVFGLSWLIFDFLGTRLHWSSQTIGCAVLTGGLCNTSFVGFPLVEALRGKEALAHAVVADQMGSFMCVALGSTLVVARYTGAASDLRQTALAIFRFPPFIAMVLALLSAAFFGPLPLADEVLGRLAATLSPLALFSVGLQLQLRFGTHHFAPLMLNLIWKLGLAPLLIFILGWALHISPAVFTVTVLQAAMAPMVTASILCQQNDLDITLSNLLVGLGIMLSFITVPLWNLIL